MKLLVLRCWWVALVVLAACFSPQFDDGQVKCGPGGECPPGLDCFGGVCRASDPGPDASSGFPLTVVLGGNEMGTVTSSPVGISCGSTCTQTFDAGTMVTLTATPMSGSVFVGWSGACSGTGTCTLTVATAITVTANFAVDNSLVVNLDGDGSGVVSSNPAGINCGIDCMEQFPSNTMVVLTASPATGSQFDGWSGGGCSGTGTCMVTTDAAKMVTASFSLTQHTLTVVPAGNGSGTVAATPAGIDCGADCSEAYPYGSMVTLTPTPDTGSAFTGWTGGGCSGTAPCQVMITQATEVTATFTLTTHALMVTKAGNGMGTVTSGPAGISCGSDCMESYDYGTMVTLSATPAAGSTFTGWSGGGCSGTAPCTVGITQATNVAATFTLDVYTLTVSKLGNGSGTVTSTTAGIDCGIDCSQPYNYGTMVTLTAATTTGSTFKGWGGACSGTTSSCTVTVAAATNVTAEFELTKHVLTVAKDASGNGSGTVTGPGINCDPSNTDCTEQYDYNTVVTLSASPATGSTFTGWGGACTGTGQCQVTMTQARNVTAAFTLTSHTVTITKSGTGSGKVGSTPTGIDCGTDCSEAYDYNTVVTLTAMPDPGSTFGGWSGGGCGMTSPCNVTVQTATAVIATFTLTTHKLTVAKTGNGTVSANVGMLNCGADCDETYPYGTQVTLTAVADSGWTFTSWSGGGCSGNGTCVVTIDQAQTVTATFTAGTAALTVSKLGSGAGTVTSTPAGINCGTDCSENFSTGTAVTLTAAPATGSTFGGWTGACSAAGMNTTCMLTMDGSPKTATATFNLTQHNVSVTKTGSGTVTSTDSKINCGGTCSATYNYGDTVTLVAQPAVNFKFTGWSGGGCSGTGNCVVTVQAATSVNATFEPVPYILGVKHDGNGFGTVTSMPAGIDCGADCEEPYTANTMVTLTAVAKPGSVFVKWSGACSGASTTCMVTMTGDLIAVAEFAVVQHQLTVTRSPTIGGDVFSINDSTINCGTDCTELYDHDTVVSLKPSARSGYTFTGWSGACTGNGDCDITMDAAKSVTANFVLTTYVLTANLAGNGTGQVTSSPVGITCGNGATDCSESYTENTMVQLTASPATGTDFVSWSGCTSVVGTTCNVTMNAAKSVTATFNLQTRTLTVAKAGNGTGTVTSVPTGINCGTTCSRAFNYGTNVQLTASPAAGSSFTSWSGCASTSGALCNVSMTAARNVTATFTENPPNLVFVTSTTYTGDFGGTKEGDKICESLAGAAGLPGNYRAWLSSTTQDAASRLGSPRGWVRVDKQPFTDQLSDLTSGRIFYPPRLDENGTDVGANVLVWTGTSSNGKYHSGSGACADWTSNASTVLGATGVADANSSMFTTLGASSCNAARRLLCLGIDNEAVVSPSAVSARRAFTTTKSWNPSLGIAEADTLCQDEANAASLGGKYKALLATTTASAISRFATGAGELTWARPDHTLVSIKPGDIVGPLLEAAPNSNATNTSHFANVCVFTGSTSLTTAGTAASTCNNWSTNISTVSARSGSAGRTAVATWFGGTVSTCNSSCKLYCLQD